MHIMVDVPVMIHVSIPSIQPTASHSPHIVRMSMSLQQLLLQVKGIMRTKTPLHKLVASTLLKISRRQRISNPNTLLLSILA